MSSELGAKRLGLLLELKPQAKRIGLLVNPDNSVSTETSIKDVGPAASTVGLSLEVFTAQSPDEIDAAFALMVQKQTEAFIVTPDALFSSRRVQIATLASHYALPAVYGLRDHVDAGGLMSYGPSDMDRYRLIGVYAGRVLKGEKPADMPVQRPTLLREALAINEKVLGPDHLDTAWSLGNLAGLLLEQGDPAGARPLQERALAIYEKVFGPEHPNTATSLNNLALLLQGQEDLEGARPLLERALKIYEKVLGPDHPDTAWSLNNLAGVHQGQGDLAAARSLHERALAIRENVLGPDHPDTAMSLNNLAGVHQDQGDLAGARPLFERSLAIREPGAGAREDHVVNDSATMQKQVGTAQQLGQSHSCRVRGGAHRVKHALFEIRRCRQRLADLNWPADPKHDAVGAGAANIDADHDATSDRHCELTLRGSSHD
jgi:tetratricopeptide (TPR) repeat protein